MFTRIFWYSVLAAGVLHAGVAAYFWGSQIHDYDPRFGSFWWQLFTSRTFFVSEQPVDSAPEPGGVQLVERRFTVPTAIHQIGPPPAPGPSLKSWAPPVSKIVPPGVLMPGGGARGPHAASVFGSAGMGGSFLYLLDVSGSMHSRSGLSTRLDQARREVVRSLASLPDTAQFGVILFADKTARFSSDMVPATEMLKSDAAAFLGRANSLKGTTDIVGGLSAALDFQPDVVFLVTDGIGNSDPERLLAQLDFIVRRTASHTKICPVGIHLEQPEIDFLQMLADRTGGQFSHWQGVSLSWR